MGWRLVPAAAMMRSSRGQGGGQHDGARSRTAASGERDSTNVGPDPALTDDLAARSWRSSPPSSSSFGSRAPTRRPAAPNGSRRWTSPSPRTASAPSGRSRGCATRSWRRGCGSGTRGSRGWVTTAPTTIGAVADLVQAVASPQRYWATPANFVDDLAMRWLIDLLGFPKSFVGTFTSGGSTANLVGLGAARQAAGERLGLRPSIDGIAGIPEPRVYAEHGDPPRRRAGARRARDGAGEPPLDPGRRRRPDRPRPPPAGARRGRRGRPDRRRDRRLRRRREHRGRRPAAGARPDRPRSKDLAPRGRRVRRLRPARSAGARPLRRRRDVRLVRGRPAQVDGRAGRHGGGDRPRRGDPRAGLHDRDGRLRPRAARASPGPATRSRRSTSWATGRPTGASTSRRRPAAWRSGRSCSRSAPTGCGSGWSGTTTAPGGWRTGRGPATSWSCCGSRCCRSRASGTCRRGGARRRRGRSPAGPTARPAEADAAIEARLDALNEAILHGVRARGRCITSSTRVGGRFAIRPCFVNPRSGLADADALVDEVLAVGRELAG